MTGDVTPRGATNDFGIIAGFVAVRQPHAAANRKSAASGGRFRKAK
jgi:hypothetical protein